MSLIENMTLNGLTIPKHYSSKIEVIESALHQTLYNFRELANEIEQMHMQTESIKKQLISQQELCKRKCCIGSEELKKVIESKENTIKLVASALTKLNETKNLDVLTEAYRLLFGEVITLNIDITNKESNSNELNISAMSTITPKEEPPENSSLEDDSVSEIEGTPTGRQSPIIQSKKKASTPNNTVSRDKKKCPQNWHSPEYKNIKLTHKSTPTRQKVCGRLRQQRISFVREKLSTVVDLTSTPQFSKGRNLQSDECLTNIKQEVIEDYDTLPSPTSEPMFPFEFKPLTKESTHKSKKPLSLIRPNAKTSTTDSKENNQADVTFVAKLEKSVDVLKEYPNGFASPKYYKTRETPLNEPDNSMSLLQPMIDINTKCTAVQFNSPVKPPLASNNNVVNIPYDSQSSISILRRDVEVRMQPSCEKIKRAKSPVLVPLFKEPTVRKLAEKRALPGWSCDQCRNFYDELYKDNPEMLAKKMDECSKHRGRNNPARPATPTGFWDVRWNVPEDTEEFNRQNNAG